LFVQSYQVLKYRSESFSNYNNAIRLSIIYKNRNIGFKLDRLNLEEINDKKN